MIQSRHPVCLGVNNTTHFYTGHCIMYIIVPKLFCCNMIGTHRKITYVALLHRLFFMFLYTVSSLIFPSFAWPHQSNKLLHLAHAAPLLKNCPHQTEEGAGPKMGAGDNQPCIHDSIGTTIWLWKKHLRSIIRIHKASTWYLDTGSWDVNGKRLEDWTCSIMPFLGGNSCSLSTLDSRSYAVFVALCSNVD